MLELVLQIGMNGKITLKIYITMEQNNIWMRFLQLGLIISLTFTFISCNKKTEYAQLGEFWFINQTNYNITYKQGFEKFNVMANSSTLIKDTQDAVKKVEPNKFHAPFRSIGLPVVIKFNQIKCLEIDVNSEHSILDIKNYLAEKLSERKYKFTYTFTEADYNRAVACP